MTVATGERKRQIAGRSKLQDRKTREWKTWNERDVSDCDKMEWKHCSPEVDHALNRPSLHNKVQRGAENARMETRHTACTSSRGGGISTFQGELMV